MTLPIPTVCSRIREGGDSNYGPHRPAALGKYALTCSLWLLKRPEKTGLTPAISSEWPFFSLLAVFAYTSPLSLNELFACI